MKRLILCVAAVFCALTFAQAAQDEPEQLEVEVFTTGKGYERSGYFYVGAFLYRTSMTIEVLMDDYGEAAFRIYDDLGNEYESVEESLNGFERVLLTVPDIPGRYCLWISSASVTAFAYFDVGVNNLK